MQHLFRELTSDEVIANCQFIHQSIYSYMAEPNEDGSDDLNLLQPDTFKDFCNLSNILETGKVAEQKRAKKLMVKKSKNSLKPIKAVTTPVVSETFAHIFNEQMMEKKKDTVSFLFLLLKFMFTSILVLQAWLDLEDTKKVVRSAFQVHLKASPRGKRAYKFHESMNGVVE